MTEPTEAQEYAGPARLAGHEVVVRLRGQFEPIDGRFHWWGRVEATDAMGAQKSGTTVVVETPRGRASGRLTDQDPWGRYRISGTGRPPF